MSSTKAYLAPKALLLGLLLLVLSACGARLDQTVTFYDDQGWNAEIVVTIPQELLAMPGARAEIDAEIAGEVQKMERAGARVSYEPRNENGQLSYWIAAEGDGINVLQRIAFEDADIEMRTVNGRKQVEFAMVVPYDLAGGTVTLIGDEILTSNGRVVEKGKVQWVNPNGRVEAVLVPRSRFSRSGWLGPLAIGGGVLAIGGVGFYLFRRRPKPMKSDFCGTCGAPHSPDARFCPACGNAI